MSKRENIAMFFAMSRLVATRPSRAEVDRLGPDRATLALVARHTIADALVWRRNHGCDPADDRAALLARLREKMHLLGDCTCGLCAETVASCFRHAIDIICPPDPEEYR